MSTIPQNELRQKIALFWNAKHAFHAAMGFPIDHSAGDFDGYVRVTEWTEVEFMPLPPEYVTDIQLAALQAARARVVEEFTAKLAGIDGQMQNLRAIAAPVADVSVSAP